MSDSNDNAFKPSAPDQPSAPPDPAAGVTSYHVLNRNSREVVGKAKTLKAARRIVERRDLEYGAAVHSIRRQPSGEGAI